MANYIATTEELTAVADAIRAKGGTSEQLVFPDGFVSAIGALAAGGGGVIFGPKAQLYEKYVSNTTGSSTTVVINDVPAYDNSKLLVLVVLHRFAISSVIDGWTKLIKTDGTDADISDGIHQYLSVYYRYGHDGKSVSINMEGNDRVMATISVYENADKPEVYYQSGFINDKSQYYAEKSTEETVLWAVSTIYWFSETRDLVFWEMDGIGSLKTIQQPIEERLGCFSDETSGGRKNIIVRNTDGNDDLPHYWGEVIGILIPHLGS